MLYREVQSFMEKVNSNKNITVDLPKEYAKNFTFTQLVDSKKFVNEVMIEYRNARVQIEGEKDMIVPIETNIVVVTFDEAMDFLNKPKEFYDPENAEQPL
jgi:hypothetical protein